MLATSSTAAVTGATTPDIVLALELAEAEVSLSVLALALALALLEALAASLLTDVELEVSVGMVTVGSVLLELPLLSVDAIVTVSSLALEAVDAELVLGLEVDTAVLALEPVAELVLEVVGAVVAALALAVVVVAVLELDVLADESLDSAAHVAEKPLTISYTLITRPLVGTVSAQSGGSSSMIDEMSDWQLVDAHIAAYSVSVGIDAEYMRLKPESSAHPSKELKVMTLANVE
jgi:hypothetical protein